VLGLTEVEVDTDEQMLRVKLLNIEVPKVVLESSQPKLFGSLTRITRLHSMWKKHL
jgi:hypothetical protein